MGEHKEVWAYGGDCLHAPENTLPAYWGALGAGADGLVVSIQLTRDGVPVCHRQQTLEPTCGDPRRVRDVTSKELRALDAGSQFRSAELDASGLPAAPGSDTPWEGAQHKQVPLHHPTLEEVLRLFGRRTHLNLVLGEPGYAGGVEQVDWEELGDAVGRLLVRFGLGHSVLVTGHAAAKARERASDVGSAYWHAIGVLADPLPILEATKGRDRYVILDGRFCEGGKVNQAIDKALGRAAPVLVAAVPALAVSGSVHESLARKKWLAGYVCRGTLAAAEMLRPRGLIAEDSFAGKDVSRDLWTIGYAKANQDARVRQDDGLVIQIRKAGEYASAAALTAYPITGDFDAQMDFEVQSPQQGTTFELACIQIDPGYHHMDNTKLDRRSVNLTFDVHGAPPYASSERDEDNGFRIGWNNGPAVTEFVRHNAQSSNLYNKYSRDVGDGARSNPAGSLRLLRCGDVFNAYYRDRHNRQWVL